MLSSLLRPSRGSKKQKSNRSPFSSPFTERGSPGLSRSPAVERRRVAADYDDIDDDDDDDEDSDFEEEEEEEQGDDNDEDGEYDDEDLNGGIRTPLLPIFEASHLDALPIYNLTHTIRLLIVPRCETTLSWDQLRSPQVSQFLVKPILKDILTSHFSRATIYALMANYLQFNKEAQTNPGNSGASKTRAMVCELLAIKLLKEYSTRELIDALSYDFDPLQGEVSRGSTPRPNWDNNARIVRQQRAARVSALEIAIRGQAKRLIAHPLVVQQLEAIWAGTIVFHSAADNMHRKPERILPNQNRGYGALDSRGTVLQADPSRLQPSKQRDHLNPVVYITRRTVTLYDPCDASLFKLSRLRVPRYRHFFSTCSLAVLLGLMTAVLYERSTSITTLEVIFWFWSAGFMLDEVVGFNEQGFSLYIMSFWNAFDLGILAVLVAYYCLRLVGLITNDDSKRQVALLAYDVLAVNAVLLFPRLFSVLDHFRYFSQLLIAFRMMAMDMVAILILIVIVCSGFFVAFSLGFGNDEFGASNVVYSLFQLLMGFTPAAWDQWSNYNILGRAMLVLFLFITHFLVVTILITVLTNSFMAIVQNANDEHQFVFAVNTISMVKSDALFSYIAPTNILAWLLTPLRFVLSFRKFVRLNRTVIKATHFPLLFSIYLYERLVLKLTYYEPTELVEQRGRGGPDINALTLPGTGGALFSPGNHRLRHERSVATFQKDRALDEVFRRPFRDETFRQTTQSQERRKTSNVVNHWMSSIGPNGRASPPPEQDNEIVARLERPKPQAIRESMRKTKGRAFSSATKSIASDPEGFVTSRTFGNFLSRRGVGRTTSETIDELPPQTDDVDGDDEIDTNDDNDAATIGAGNNSDKENEEHYFQSTPPINARLRQPLQEVLRTPSSDRQASVSFNESPIRSVRQSPIRPRKHHQRNLSTNTMIFNPVQQPSMLVQATQSNRNSRDLTALPGLKPPSPPNRIPSKRQATTTRARPILPSRATFQSQPNLTTIGGMVPLDSPNRRQKRSALALDLASDLGDNKEVGGGLIGAVPASFATQMGWARSGLKGLDRKESDHDDHARMSKLMLARMNELEQGFREVLREVKDWRRDGGSGSTSAAGSVIGPIGGGGAGWGMQGHRRGAIGSGDGFGAGVTGNRGNGRRSQELKGVVQRKMEELPEPQYLGNEEELETRDAHTTSSV